MDGIAEPARSGHVRYLLDGVFREMAYVEWGAPDATPVVCVHGLTRNGRDFDALAAALASRFRVVCPDLPGRGRSDWLGNAALYQPPSYVQALSHLLAAIGREVLWVGTSLGGIVGMAIASMPGQPIRRLVLNDIGPCIPAAALRRIRDYMSEPAESFPDEATLAAHLRRIHAPFGALGDAGWAALARHSGRVLPDGRLALHYDPAIAEPMRAAEPVAVDLSPYWSRIAIPVLAIRGAESDLLLPETFARMRADGAEGLEIPGAGHAPALMDAASIGAVARFLEA